MHKLNAVIILLILPVMSFAQKIQNNCIECHKSLQGAMGEPALHFQNDIHERQGLSCQDCHGGNAGFSSDDNGQMKANAHGSGFIGKPSRFAIPKLCGRCHSDPNYMRKFDPNIRVDQYVGYLTSVHGSRWLKGDKKVAVCTSCHHVHQIRKINDAQASTYPTNIPSTCGACHSSADYMAEYKIPTNQESQYRKSIHAEYLYKKGDLTAPTCISCHGYHGATPPGVKSVIFVCGVCHPSQQQYFSNSTHKEYFDNLNAPGCITCHSNHYIIPVNDGMIQVKEKNYFCGKCHSEGDEEETPIMQIRGTIDSLKNEFRSADSLLRVCAVKGIEVSEPQYQLSQAYAGIIQTRNGVHTFAPVKMAEMAKPYLISVKEAHKKGLEGLREAKVRRIGLMVAFFAIIMLIIGVIMLIRQRERAST